jgi:uncharacterized Zn ribbon protein
MVETLRIDTGAIRLAINGDENRIIEFNPEDIVFVERFYSLIKEFESKEVEFREKAEELAGNSELDEYGIPVNTGDNIKLVKDLCTYLMTKIDYVFGQGTSAKVFENNQTLNMFEQFFTGITPYVQKARGQKLEKYRK